MNRVVVTGLGTINPCGSNVEEFFNNITEGKTGIKELSKGSYEGCKVKFAGEINDFSYEHVLTKKEFRRMDLFTAYSLVASDEAVKDSGINLDEIQKDRFSVYIGSGIGGFSTIQEQAYRSFSKGADRLSPLFIPNAIGNMAAGNVSIKYGAQGSSLAVVSACATSTSCIGTAFRDIKHGYSDLALAGGSEAAISEISIGGFSALTALSEATELDRVSIPFDSDRDGFCMGEGSGMLLLESYEHAKKRGAKIYAELVGYGSTCDANHITSPREDGAMMKLAIEKAMIEGNVDKNDIDYINAHGTGTKFNDSSETLAIKKVFGDKAYDINISSTKSMTGHLLGGAGGVEAIATIKAMENGVIPPTINLQKPDPECDLNYTPNKSVEREVKYALSSSLGFGGHNEVLCFKKWED